MPDYLFSASSCSLPDRLACSISLLLGRFFELLSRAVVLFFLTHLLPIVFYVHYGGSVAASARREQTCQVHL